MIIFGVVLPAITLALEWGTHMCGDVFFDPIPTWGHVLLVALVPVVNGVALVALYRPAAAWARWLWRANGVVLGIALCYAILFLPISPFAVIGIIAFGVGLLPLSPLLSFIVAWRTRALLRRRWNESNTTSIPWWIAFLVGLVAVGLLALPQNLTRHLEHMASSDNATEATRGIQWLRKIGREETLLQDCYGTTRGDSLFKMEIEPVATAKAQELFYRVTGRVFNSVPRPRHSLRMRGRGSDDFEWDAGVGGDTVGGVVKGLTLKESRLDATCSPDDAWGYVEWIMEFHNASAVDREARAQIALPPGAVVSRLTLWVDGEEREAAFAGRAQTKQAYREVAVVQRRDPVLVTTCGPDRILMQCFPILPGRTMKIRLGITEPLWLNNTGEAVLQWPSIIERNFKLGLGFTHAVWLQSPRPPAGKLVAFKLESPAPDNHHIRGQIADTDLAGGTATVALQRDAGKTTCISSNQQRLVEQHIAAVAPRLPARVVVVVDGSGLMGTSATQIADALAGLQKNTELVVLLAHDEITSTNVSLPTLRQFSYRGGHDNLPALVNAWEIAAEKPGSVVLWIHAPQALALSSVERLRQLMERGDTTRHPAIIDLAIHPGPDRVFENFDGLASIHRLPVIGTPVERLRNLIARWEGAVPSLNIQRKPTATGEAAASKHVARLWAKAETDRLLARRKQKDAIALASAFQLVTPVTGAGVLETAQQYAQNNLKPSDPATVPNVVPEPSLWVMLSIGLVLITATRFVRARKRAGNFP
jgi:hypothetical protein